MALVRLGLDFRSSSKVTFDIHLEFDGKVWHTVNTFPRLVLAVTTLIPLTPTLKQGKVSTEDTDIDNFIMMMSIITRHH